MLTSSFIFAKGLTEDLERAQWTKGITSWEVLRQYPEEAAIVLGQSRAQKLVEQVVEGAGGEEEGRPGGVEGEAEFGDTPGSLARKWLDSLAVGVVYAPDKTGMEG